MIHIELFTPIYLNKQVGVLASETGVPEHKIHEIFNATLLLDSEAMKLVKSGDANLHKESILCGAKALEALGAKESPIKTIYIPYQLYGITHINAWDDICYFCARIIRTNERYMNLVKMCAPKIIIMNEERNLRKAVELLETNNLLGYKRERRPDHKIRTGSSSDSSSVNSILY